MYCSTCSTSFDLEVEGMAGDFGIIPVAFCATCRVCVKDLAEQQWDLVPRPDDYEEELRCKPTAESKQKTRPLSECIKDARGKPEPPRKPVLFAAESEQDAGPDHIPYRPPAGSRLLDEVDETMKGLDRVESGRGCATCGATLGLGMLEGYQGRVCSAKCLVDPADRGRDQDA